MDEISKIVIEEFNRKDDGSWVCLKTTDIITKSGSIVRVPPGASFRKGVTFCGLRVAEALDEINARNGN